MSELYAYCVSATPTEEDRIEAFNYVVQRCVPSGGDKSRCNAQVQQHLMRAVYRLLPQEDASAQKKKKQQQKKKAKPKRRQRGIDWGNTNNDDDDDDDADDDDLINDMEDVPTICPLSKQFIKVPARLKSCQHSMCCDLESWIAAALHMRSARLSTLRFTCPHCSTDGGRVDDIEIDLYLMQEFRRILLGAAGAGGGGRYSSSSSSSSSVALPPKVRFFARERRCEPILPKSTRRDDVEVISIDCSQLTQLTQQSNRSSAVNLQQHSSPVLPQVKQERLSGYEKKKKNDDDDDEDDGGGGSKNNIKGLSFGSSLVFGSSRGALRAQQSSNNDNQEEEDDGGGGDQEESSNQSKQQQQNRQPDLENDEDDDDNLPIFGEDEDEEDGEDGDSGKSSQLRQHEEEEDDDDEQPLPLVPPQQQQQSNNNIILPVFNQMDLLSDHDSDELYRSRRENSNISDSGMLQPPPPPAQPHQQDEEDSYSSGGSLSALDQFGLAALNQQYQQQQPVHTMSRQGSSGILPGRTLFITKIEQQQRQQQNLDRSSSSTTTSTSLSLPGSQMDGGVIIVDPPLPPLKGQPFCISCGAYCSKTPDLSGNNNSSLILARHSSVTCEHCGAVKAAELWSYIWQDMSRMNNDDAQQQQQQHPRWRVEHLPAQKVTLVNLYTPRLQFELSGCLPQLGFQGTGSDSLWVADGFDLPRDELEYLEALLKTLTVGWTRERYQEMAQAAAARRIKLTSEAQSWHKKLYGASWWDVYPRPLHVKLLCAGGRGGGGRAHGDDMEEMGGGGGSQHAALGRHGGSFHSNRPSVAMTAVTTTLAPQHQHQQQQSSNNNNNNNNFSMPTQNSYPPQQQFFGGWGKT